MKTVLTTFLASPDITWMTLLKHMGLKKQRLRLLKRLQIMPPLLGSLPRTQPGFFQEVIWETSLTWGGTPVRLIGGRIMDGAVIISSLSRKGL